MYLPACVSLAQSNTSRQIDTKHYQLAQGIIAHLIAALNLP
jgi:hypothetical protein